jgi:hypothetical protein
MNATTFILFIDIELVIVVLPAIVTIVIIDVIQQVEQVKVYLKSFDTSASTWTLVAIASWSLNHIAAAFLPATMLSLLLTLTAFALLIAFCFCAILFSCSVV